jgi:uncharacterized membrane protein YbhN (UPF0104 family)
MRRALVAVAAVVFVGATVLAWRALPPTESPLSWPPIVVAGLLGVPALIVLTSIEYVLSVRAVDGQVSLMGAVRLNIVASAANLLPVPGSIMVRIQGLRNSGASYRAATASTAVVGIVWMSLSLLAAGLLQVAVSRPGIGGLAVAAGVVLALLAWTMARLQPGVEYTPALTAQVVAVEVARVAVLAVRFHLLLVALGTDPVLAQSMALTIAVVVSTAVALLPGGLGLRELSAAAIGPLVGLPASVSLLAVALDRLLSLAVLAVAAGVLALRRNQ